MPAGPATSPEPAAAPRSCSRRSGIRYSGPCLGSPCLYPGSLAGHLSTAAVVHVLAALDIDDPILGNSALDRLANASYQIVIEGNSYREKLSPHRKLLGERKVIDPPKAT